MSHYERSKLTFIAALAVATSAVLSTVAHAQEAVPSKPETITVGPCLIGSVTEHLEHGAMRVKWTQSSAIECAKDPALTQYTRAMASDIASTALGLNLSGGSLVEANPLGLAGGLVLKVGGYVALRMTEPSPGRTRFAAKASAVQWGATANNLCLLVGAAAPVCIALGLAVGVDQWP
jgi:hypothetical protein